MVINNAINSPLPTSLALGGTNAALTTSNGGIFYSTASSGAILSGTSTANQAILSGSSITPSWSTATYPATTTANQLLYSSATNVIGGLATANSACMVSDNIIFPVVIPYPVWSLPMQDGQIVIGGTSGRPEPFNITAGNNITILNRPGAVNIYSTAVPGNWEFIDSQTAFSSFSNTAQTSIDFDNQLLTGYIAYRLVVKNIIPHQNYTVSNDCNLSLRFGTGLGPYISSHNYHYQICSIKGNGDNIYLGETNDDQVLLTYNGSGGNSGISNDASFGGVSGIIDLFVRPDTSQVANGISKLSYMANINGTLEYVNVTSTFQIDISDFYTSVQLFLDREIPIIAGSVSLYGLNTLSDGSENFQWITTQYANSYLNFLNTFKQKYIGYRLIINNILPTNNGINLYLRFGDIDSFISTFDYTYQQCCISSNGVNNFYHGYNGGGLDHVFLTLTNIHGISPDPAYGGVCGTIDFFVTPGTSQVANGIARLGYIASDGIMEYINTTSTFQLPLPNNYTSVQLFLEGTDLMVSGSATLYGLHTMV